MGWDVAGSLASGLSNLPVTISKVIIAGHSYASPVNSTMNAGFSTSGMYSNAGSLRDRGKWTDMVQDVLGPAFNAKFLYVAVPASIAAADWYGVVPVPEECWIDAVSYYMAGSSYADQINPSTSNYRTWSIAVPTTSFGLAWAVIGALNTTLNSVPQAGGYYSLFEYPIIAFSQVFGNSQGLVYGYLSAAAVAASTYPTLTNTAPVVGGNKLIRLGSVHTGTGAADPGGTFVIRLSGRFRNYAVGGAAHILSGIYQGGWATSMNPAFNPKAQLPQFYAPPINLTAAFVSCQATAGGTISTSASSVAVTANTLPASGTFSMWTSGGAKTVTYTGGGGTTTLTGCTIASGSFTYAIAAQCCQTTIACQATTGTFLGGGGLFSNGTQVTLGISGTGATSLTAAAVAGGDYGTAAVGTQAVQTGLTPANSWGYEYQTSPGLAILMTGVNDAGSATQDTNAWAESIRAWAAFQGCSSIYFNQNPPDANVVLAAGNGAAATWAAQVQPAGGQFGGAVSSFTGAVGGTPPSITINLNQDYDGSAICLFFLAWAGAANGGAASIKVDGTGPVTVSTVGACPNQNILTKQCSLSGTTATITSGANFSVLTDLGKLITGVGIPANTYITAVAFGGTSATVSNSMTTEGAETVTIYGAVPMVKRLVGLIAGVAHQIVVTLTSMFATDGSATFNFLGYGFEPTTVLTSPVLLCSIPMIPSVTEYGIGSPNTNSAALNAATIAVIAGTQAGAAGNSLEPALSPTVQLCDINAALNNNVIYFSTDGLHPNTLGQTILAKTVVSSIRGFLTQQQAISR